MARAVYPFHASFRDALKTVSAPLDALKLTRHIAVALDVSHTEVEIIFVLIGSNSPTNFNIVAQSLDHLTLPRIKRLLKNLVNKNYVIESKSGDSVSYQAIPDIVRNIKQLDRSSVGVHDKQ